MTSTGYTPVAPAPDELRRRGVRLGDVLFRGVSLAAALAAAALLALIAWKVLDLAWPAIQEFGLSFIWTDVWNPVTDSYGALAFVYGTVMTSLIALALATPLSIAIALFLTEISPRRLAGPIATMVELLAAIPSVVLGLWGILVFGPWVRDHLEPWLKDVFGFLPIFSGEPWEAIRKVLLPYAAPGIAAAILLGLGRAFGEAIAVNQVIGGGNVIPSSWFEPADTLGSRIAAQYQGATSVLQAGSILYLAAILMVISLVTNVVAQLVVARFERARRAY